MSDFLEFLLEQLRDLEGGVTARAMFGAHGLYSGGTFFAIVWRGTLYLKTDARSRSQYVRRGMTPFQPNAKQTLKRYYQAPADVIDSRRHLLEWSERAVRARDSATSRRPQKA